MRAPVWVTVAVVLGGCALRPRYADFVTQETTAPVKVLLVEKKSGAPVANAAIEIGERNRVTVRTSADGTAMLPIEKRFLDDNALLVINTPAGVGRTQMSVAPVVAPQPPAAAPEPAPADTTTY